MKNEVEILNDPGVSRIFEPAGRIRRTTVILGVLLGWWCGFGKAEGALMTYTWSSIGSGSLGTNSFVDTPFTITTTADVSHITEAPYGVLLLPNIAARVSVSGFDPATFTIPTDSVVNRSNSAVGIGAPIQDDAILFEINSAFATYDLGSPIGPIDGPPARSFDSRFATTGGTFSLSAVSTVTFQAVLEGAGPTLSISMVAEAVEICWPTQANRSYQVQWAASLDSTEWLNLGSPVAGTGMNICVSDSTRDTAKRFYRMEVLP